MKALTCLVVGFCLIYYVQNFSLPGLDSFGKLKNQTQDFFTRNSKSSKNVTSSTNLSAKNTTSGNNNTSPKKLVPANNNSTAKKNTSDPDAVCYPPLGKLSFHILNFIIRSLLVSFPIILPLLFALQELLNY